MGNEKKKRSLCLPTRISGMESYKTPSNSIKLPVLLIGKLFNGFAVSFQRLLSFPLYDGGKSAPSPSRSIMSFVAFYYFLRLALSTPSEESPQSFYAGYPVGESFLPAHIKRLSERRKMGRERERGDFKIDLHSLLWLYLLNRRLMI